MPQPAYQPADEAATQAWIARVAGYAQACKTSAGFPLLEHMTTLDNARDLDSIRRALGVEKVSYWGTSYGTYLGQVFMTQYPQHVDKVIHVDLPIVGDVGHVLEDLLKIWKSRGRKTNPAVQQWWAQIEGWRARNCRLRR